jgi:ferric-dicitrate binding protein FerR (iron transport regulator)
VIPEKADLRRIGAWRMRRLEFSNTTLRTAVEEFNRYSGTRVVIGSPELETVRVADQYVASTRTCTARGSPYQFPPKLLATVWM